MWLKRLFPVMLTVCALWTVSAQNTFFVTGAWARPGEDMTGVYLQIANTGDEADRLIGVQTSIGMAEIHEMRMENDIMRMTPVAGIDIPAGETVRLQPGGLRIMVMGLEHPLREGDTLSLTLTFESGAAIAVEAWVSHTPIPHELEPDALTDAALIAVENETYVGQVVNPPIQVQDFQAPASDATITRLSDTDGTWRMIFFGYMHCPDFCPLTLVDYRQVKSMLGDAAEDVSFIFISVDAVRDTPEVIHDYLANFDPTFIGFSVDDATLSRIQPDYDFYYSRRMAADSLAVYTVDHSTRSYLLDPDGVLRASFAYATEPRQIADALLWYMEHD